MSQGIFDATARFACPLDSTALGVLISVNPRAGARPVNGTLPGASNGSLRSHAREALDRYFEALDGHECCGLYDLVLTEVEVPMLEAVLEHTQGNLTRAATLLSSPFWSCPATT